jgi:hypothetical protein
MVKLVQCFFDISGHGHVAGAGSVVPVQGEATVKSTSPVCGGRVKVTDGTEEMLGMGATGILDAKIINNEAELEWHGIVCL